MNKLIPALLLAVAMTPTAALAERYSQPGYSTERTCYKDVYREEYVPGTRNNPGRVRRWTDREEVPCRDQGYGGGYVPDEYRGSSDYDDNSCLEGTIIGGIAGGAIGGAAATQENWIWSIPAGVIGGAVVGCQFDGG